MQKNNGINKKKQIKDIPVSVIVPTRNAKTTILLTLKSIIQQTYPIKEIIIIDNVSKDNSVEIALNFSKNSRIPIKVIRNSSDKGVGGSYNLGASIAQSAYLVFMHSDSVLPTRNELSRLISPFKKDPEVVASYPLLIHPKKVWLTYNFWEKCLLARSQNVKIHSLNGKFDCYKKTIFLKIGGFDEHAFGSEVGAEDANLHFRLKRIGKVIPTNAKVLHLHYLGGDYTLAKWIQNRKYMARSYGTLLRIHFRDLGLGSLPFLIKPLIAIGTLFPIVNIYFMVFLLIFVFVYMKNIYLEPTSLKDVRILLLPLVSIFFVYYETFWMIEAFFFIRKKEYNAKY